MRVTGWPLWVLEPAYLTLRNTALLTFGRNRRWLTSGPRPEVTSERGSACAAGKAQWQLSANGRTCPSTSGKPIARITAPNLGVEKGSTSTYVIHSFWACYPVLGAAEQHLEALAAMEQTGRHEPLSLRPTKSHVCGAQRCFITRWEKHR